MKDNNENIKKMANFLRSGATMLDKYCPACSNILFQLKNGQIFCPVCEKEVRIVSEYPTDDVIIESFDDSKNQLRESFSFAELNNYFAGKIRDFIEKLEKINDIQITNQILNNISITLKIIKDLRELEKKY